MAKEITFEDFLTELDSLPDVARKMVIEEDKRDLSRRRSNFLGGSKRKGV